MLKKVNWKNYRELSGAATDAAITRTLLHSQLLYAFTVDLCYMCQESNWCDGKLMVSNICHQCLLCLSLVWKTWKCQGI